MNLIKQIKKLKKANKTLDKRNFKIKKRHYNYCLDDNLGKVVYYNEIRIYKIKELLKVQNVNWYNKKKQIKNLMKKYLWAKRI